MLIYYNSAKNNKAKGGVRLAQVCKSKTPSVPVSAK